MGVYVIVGSTQCVLVCDVIYMCDFDVLVFVVLVVSAESVWGGGGICYCWQYTVCDKMRCYLYM